MMGIFIAMPAVYHFDIPIDDANRAQQFYRNVFGWDMKKVENQVDPKVELWMCETEDENGKKGVTGGMMKRDTLPTVTNYVLVNSIDQYISKINKSGGRVTVQRTEIPNVGFYAMFLDSENNLFGLFEKK
jgi:predicted enzyme related to lactoylglutathione lyase